MGRIEYVERMKKRDDKRTTISLAQVVWAQAEFLMERKGFNKNFSAYVADLVRRDHERFTMTEADRAELLRQFGGQPPNEPTPKPRAAVDHKRQAA